MKFCFLLNMRNCLVYLVVDTRPRDQDEFSKKRRKRRSGQKISETKKMSFSHNFIERQVAKCYVCKSLAAEIINNSLPYQI